MAQIKYKSLTIDNMFDFCSVLDAIGTEQIIKLFNPKRSPQWVIQKISVSLSQ